MNLSCGIVGLANVGKSTLFNALLKKQVAASANYPFTTIEPNVGVVEVPDERLEKLAEVIAVESTGPAGLHPTPTLRQAQGKLEVYPEGIRGTAGARAGAPRPSPVLKYPPIVPAIVKFVDIAGLVKGAHKGEGLGNQFLAHIREVDVIVFVLRGFKSEDIIRSGSIDPKDDLEVLKSELLLKDLETIDKKLETLNKETKNLTQNDPRYAQVELVRRAQSLIQQGKWVAYELSAEGLSKISDLQLLSAKRSIVVVNSDEGDLTKDAPIEGGLRICAKLEEELASLSDQEQREYLDQLGVKESGLEKLIKRAYETLDLATFLTAGPKEVRAWTIAKGTLAPQAAGVIHSDFERGFIAADIVPYDEFVKIGGWQKSREKGLVKTIGKSEEIADGMVVEFKFSV